MENTPMTSQSVPLTARRRVRGRVVAALAATVLLFPAIGVTNAPDQVVPAIVLPVTVAIWVAVLGLRDIPRPVLTGTLAGLAYGAVLMTVSLVSGAGEVSPGLHAVAAVFEIGWSTLLGTGLGLLGSGLQQIRGRRP
ncbi:hypothetical protein J1G44_03095 [Cellulomonas sp. zg-ZUI199]|uniref:Uncharacterized protein n=1 Tax=Cellulomonas wangleii TaxID=2816956 RepID=A0ABX8D2W7_9CELL|nr:hypothetical protein [Cellulomonas wangleii]MBO0923464.1 hypothetical protein [Cellulomonas wangleii]QVI61808.1 hypothetical protein KG103_15380 [Cellulomonas wangleii]